MLATILNSIVIIFYGPPSILIIDIFINKSSPSYKSNIHFRSCSLYCSAGGYKTHNRFKLFVNFRLKMEYSGVEFLIVGMRLDLTIDYLAGDARCFIIIEEFTREFHRVGCINYYFSGCRM